MRCRYISEFEVKHQNRKTVKIYLKLFKFNVLLSVIQLNYELSDFNMKKYAELRIVISLGI